MGFPGVLLGGVVGAQPAKRNCGVPDLLVRIEGEVVIGMRRRRHLLEGGR